LALEITLIKVAEDWIYIMLSSLQMMTTENTLQYYRSQVWNDTDGTVTHFVSAMGYSRNYW
jgi:hypothetical protein